MTRGFTNKASTRLIKNYYWLAKPGIIYGNVITAAGGFFLASRGHIDVWLLITTLAGLSFIIASACVFNNYIDRGIDGVMSRTKNRSLVSGAVSGQSALIYAAILGLSGVSLLALFTNLLTLFISLTGFFVYVVLYGIGKRRSEYGTIIGSISGAVPPVVGYCAVSNRFDSGALILFMILVFWQMPHFFAIAMYRLDDYTAAGLPVLPVKRGEFITKLHMLFYIVAFIITAGMLTIFGYTGYIYLIIAGILGFSWLGYWIKGLRAENNKLWARQMFRFSLIVITTLCGAIAADSVLH
jgi:protoheme IX farnesyltransferase